MNFKRMSSLSIIFSSWTFLASTTITFAQSAWPQGMPEWRPPENGIVPDQHAAVKIAEAILWSLGQSGKQELEKFKPWKAQLVGDAWQVRGTLPRNAIGGTYVVVVAKADGRVVGIFHEQ
jgi:hypothetical protein